MDAAAVRNRISLAARAHATLSPVSSLANPQTLPRFREAEVRDAFRRNLVETLRAGFVAIVDDDEAASLLEEFAALATQIRENGAVAFAELCPQEQFATFLSRYEQAMSRSATVGLFHTYCNLREEIDLLTNREMQDIFLHPLMIALIAFHMGAPIRLTDARAKDTDPIEIRAQDNNLHTDNSPFSDETKILLMWKKGEVRGPDGQNFVYLPGTNFGIRRCEMQNGEAVSSTEGASIFNSAESLESVLTFQASLGRNTPEVIEARHARAPLAVIFEASTLVHHRYRTLDGESRSCLIIAFHSSNAHPGTYYEGAAPLDRSRLADLVLSHQRRGNADEFLAAISASCPQILRRLKEIRSAKEIFAPVLEKMTPDRFLRWSRNVHSAPEVEDLKARPKIPTGATSAAIFEIAASEMMPHDKYGPMDLIIYPDGHEEIRKWARNRIREMPPATIRGRLRHWEGSLAVPTVEQLLSLSELSDIAREVRQSAQRVDEALFNVWPTEGVSAETAKASLVQLLGDLGECLRRSHSLQNCLTASLFLFWACDSITQVSPSDSALADAGGKIVQHYLALAAHLGDHPQEMRR